MAQFGWRTFRQKCRRLWHNCAKGWVFAGKGQHPFDIPLRKSFYLRHVVRDVPRQPRDDARAPAFFFLHGGDGAANVPIEADEFRVGRERGFDLRGADAVFHRAEKRRVAGKARFANDHCFLWSWFHFLDYSPFF